MLRLSGNGYDCDPIGRAFISKIGETAMPSWCPGKASNGENPNKK